MVRRPSSDRAPIAGVDPATSKQRQGGSAGTALRRRLLSTSGLCVALPLAAGLWAAPQAARANDPCNIVGSTATCTGDQASGVQFLNGSGINTLNVLLLTGPIQPAATVPGIQLQQAGANGVAAGDSGVSGDALAVTVAGGLPAATIVTQGAGAHGIIVTSTGGNGVVGAGLAGAGGAGGNGGNITITNGAKIDGSGADAHGIVATTTGGVGQFGFGGVGAAGNGGIITIVNTGAVTMTGDNSIGILAQSTSGNAPIGGALATGGAIDITNSGAVSAGLAGSGAHGIFAQSMGLGGFNGSNASGVDATGQGGGAGHSGGAVSITNSATVLTFAAGSHGLFATSVSGTGGIGGDGNGLSGSGAGGGGAGSVGAITIANTGAITTTGANSYGIYGFSSAAVGGNGGSAGGASASGGGGGAGGTAGAVTITSSSIITTSGGAAYGIYAASFGGGGGSGGNATGFFDANGGAGGTGGASGNVTVTTTGLLSSQIHTSGDAAHGIYAISRGGAGGGAGNAGAIFGQAGGAGAGGAAGTVTVTQGGVITTSGNGAYGILAESTGGGGGSGGTGGGIVGIGSGGGAASPGGIVNVTVNGVIATTGDFSHAVSASSIGGGGGAGGNSGGLVSIGGGGSSSGSADHVTVINNGNITTTGGGAYGIFAQSVGGGGGNGGNAGGWISVGGSGGAGGNGGLVDVTNNNFIKTTGTYGHGIFAQSVGGGGGDGGYGISGGQGPLTVAIGGTGGEGGFGSAVHVVNNGTVIVTGYRAASIFAQSVGGGGGNGGDATAIGLTVASVAIGGGGGKGGAGGTVTVDNVGLLATQSDRSVGIYAQSVGGGGGNGGASMAVAVNIVSIAVAVGGYGGDGGNGGLVTVNQKGEILTTGANSYGIYAQSVGGGGGQGGAAVALSVTASPKQSASIAVAVGGKGGTAGDGGDVVTTNTGSIVTLGAGATGIMAQSIGGGGGDGGSADATAVVFFAAKQNLAVAVGVGGAGGAAGNGKNVTVTNVGRIVTQGDDAHGIHAQSVGGGGGNGGAGRATAMAASTDVNLKNYADKVIAIVNTATRGDTLPETPDIPFFPDLPQEDKKKADDTKKDPNKKKGGSQSVSIAIGVGGTGGAAGNGGTVIVNNIGRIDTFGFMSYGILAQSIGGGGGTAGGGSSNADGGTVNVGGGFGGGGGSAGSGGNVTVTNTGLIRTRGHDAVGIVAQSIGGGGGVGGSGDANAGIGTGSIALAVGGQGGAAATDFGGHVTVSQTGDLITVGDRAHGVLAQSIGAGGGLGGFGTAGNASTIFVGGTGGGGAAGGQVDVTVVGDILTFGISAHGVLAQSIGGGGGIGGDLSGSILTVGVGVGGFGGNSGDGGTVNINTTGIINTKGMRAYGILAQSIGGGGGLGGQGEGAPLSLSFAGSNGGNGAGGAININHTGSVIAEGQGSHAIFAQSTGGNGGGNITINLQGGVISGGTVDAAGISIDQGATNTINIAANAVVTALSGLAIQGSGGGTNTVNNSGTVLGNVEIHTLPATFNNLATGLFVPTTEVDLSGGTLNNAGTLNLGGTKTVVTALTGNFAQSTTGIYAVDVRFGSNPSDLMNVSGTAEVRGFVKPTALSLVPNTVATILNAAGGFAGINDATTVNTPIITYGLQYVGNDLQVNVQNVNFNPAAFAGGLNPNQTNVANHFQNVWGTGLPSNLADTMGYLVNFTNAAGYAAALDKLHPEPYLLQATGAVMTGLSFLDGMLSCRGSQAPLAAIRESQCAWFKFTGGAVNQQATSDAMGYREVGQRYQVGVQTAMAPDWWRGFAVSYETARTTTGSATTNADRFDIGVSVKHLHGNWLFATAANVGFATLDTSRFIGFPAPGLTAKGQTTIWHLDARFRASYLIESGITYAKPSVDVDLIYVNMAGFTETGAGPLNLRVNSVNEVMAALTPAIEFGASFRGNDGAAVVRPFASGGFSLFTRNNWTVSSTFEGTPTTVAPFNTSTAFPGMLYRTTLGVDFISTRKTGGLDMRFLYEGQFSHGYQSHTGSVKASVRF